MEWEKGISRSDPYVIGKGKYCGQGMKIGGFWLKEKWQVKEK